MHEPFQSNSSGKQFDYLHVNPLNGNHFHRSFLERFLRAPFAQYLIFIAMQSNIQLAMYQLVWHQHPLHFDFMTSILSRCRNCVKPFRSFALIYYFEAQWNRFVIIEFLQNILWTLLSRIQAPPLLPFLENGRCFDLQPAPFDKIDFLHWRYLLTAIFQCIINNCERKASWRVEVRKDH